jgi:hypothetical protein
MFALQLVATLAAVTIATVAVLGRRRPPATDVVGGWHIDRLHPTPEGWQAYRLNRVGVAATNVSVEPKNRDIHAGGRWDRVDSDAAGTFVLGRLPDPRPRVVVRWTDTRGKRHEWETDL